MLYTQFYCLTDKKIRVQAIINCDAQRLLHNLPFGIPQPDLRQAFTTFDIHDSRVEIAFHSPISLKATKSFEK